MNFCVKSSAVWQQLFYVVFQDLTRFETNSKNYFTSFSYALNFSFLWFVVENKMSDPVHVKFRESQGAVLGPLFFLFHISDLRNSVYCKSSLFAFDSIVYNRMS